MHRSRAPSIAPGTFFVAQSWAGCITNMPGFNLRQAQVTTADFGTVTETNWAGVTIKWDNRSVQTILHNDMAQVERVPNKVV
jgi:hypothetical protein